MINNKFKLRTKIRKIYNLIELIFKMMFTLILTLLISILVTADGHGVCDLILNKMIEMEETPVYKNSLTYM